MPAAAARRRLLWQRLAFDRLSVRHEDSWVKPAMRSLIFVPQWNAWPRGFRCLVAHAPVFDTEAIAYETDELASPGKRENPVDHVAAWSTPLLTFHGERDSGVPYTQSIAAFTAAQRRGVPSRLVVFPDEGREIEKPKNRIQWYGETFTWLRTWLTRVKNRDGCECP